MKTYRYTSILLFCTVHHVVVAQSDEFLMRRVISKYEITAGTGIVTGPSRYSRETRQSFSFGAGVSHVFYEKFELKVRALYELKGGKTMRDLPIWHDGVPTNYAQTITTDQYFLTVSVLPTFHFAPKRNVLLGAGPFFSFLSKVWIRQDLTEAGTNVTTSLNVIGPRNPDPYTELGVSAYTGYVCRLSKKTDLAMMLHYNRSLKEFDDPYNGWFVSDVFLVSATLGIFR